MSVSNLESVPNTNMGKAPGKSRFAVLWRDRYLYLMLVPVLIYYIVFKYLPMYGITIAFMDYSVFKGIFKSPWVGFKHFVYFFNSRDFILVLSNTLVLKLLLLVFGFPAPIILALMLNEVRNMIFKRSIQTVLYLPHFISWVILGGMIINILSPSSGFVNYVLKALTGNTVLFLTDPGWWRFVYVTGAIWKNLGWSAIIYMAALSSISPELYEAAIIDGASKWKQIWHVSISGIRNTIAILLILRIGNLIEIGFEEVYVLQNPLVYDVSDVISTYVYRKGLVEAKYSFTTAVGLFENGIGFILVVISNKLSKKYTDVSLW